MWGTLPFGSSILAMLVVLIPEKRWHRREARSTYAPLRVWRRGGWCREYAERIYSLSSSPLQPSH